MIQGNRLWSKKSSSTVNLSLFHSPKGRRYQLCDDVVSCVLLLQLAVVPFIYELRGRRLPWLLARSYGFLRTLVLELFVTEKSCDNSRFRKIVEIINKNQHPLKLYSLIERVVMQQTSDEYPPNNLVDNLLAVLTLKQQNNQTNTQWYEKLNTRVDVAESVGVEFGNFTSLWSYCCEARQWGDYQNLTDDEQATIRNDSKERLLAYLIIANSSGTSTHESVKNNLLDAFIANRDRKKLNSGVRVGGAGCYTFWTKLELATGQL